MRIFTYPNPFEINKNPELWNAVTKHPHFCASDTLVQGLEAEYGRESFATMRTVASLINRAFKDYTNNPQNDIKLFLTVSNIIRSMPDNDIKTSFRFNIADVVESIKTLITLECDVAKFDTTILSAEQKQLIQIYKDILESDYQKVFQSLKLLSKEDFIYAMRCTVNDEIEHIAKPVIKEDSTFSHEPLDELVNGHNTLTKLLEYYENKISIETDFFKARGYKATLKKLNHIKSIMEDTDNSSYEKIIIHGVQKITPIMYFLFKCLEDKGIEIIFLINYAPNLPNVYKTWREVYSWCETKFEYQEDLLISAGNPLGISLAEIIEGSIPTKKICNEVKVFNNLTSFTDREVRQTFKLSEQKLNKMKTQYYAVDGTSSNEILKMYFPEQFEQKPFLSYPIGQFILGIYEMWDFKENTLKINEKSLTECASSNLFITNKEINLIQTITKTKLYFSDIETVEEYYLRIDKLKVSLDIINRNNRYASLEKLSFFSISYSELNGLREFLKFIENISKVLFENSIEEVDYQKHFKSLIDIISNPTVNSKILSSSEKELIAYLTDKLSRDVNEQIIGNVADVKEALFFYLSGGNKLDTSNWIVRDFEQLDGAVLLRKTSKARKYHFAMLSNSNMTNQNNDVMSWPLTENMFMGYLEASTAIPIITKGLLERRNFLKFSLFYASFFSQVDIELSYIAQENGEDQRLYYLLDVLNLNPTEYTETTLTSFTQSKLNERESSEFYIEKIKNSDKEFYSICPYKFLHKAVLKEKIEYSSEYHIKYYVSNFMFSFIQSLYNISDSDIENKLESEIYNLEKIFPFWGRTVFADIQKTTLKQINQTINNAHKNSVFMQQKYDLRKENFLIAQWAEYDKFNNISKKHMNFEKENINEKISEYMQSSQLYPSTNELPHEKVCQNCNFSELCLLDYYNAVAEMSEKG